MNNSPTTPTGTGCNQRSSTCNRTPGNAAPTGTTPRVPGWSATSRNVESTVASVTPYPVNTRTPAPNTRRARSAASHRHTSVVTTTSRNPGNVRPVCCRYSTSRSTYRGAASNASTPCPASTSYQSGADSCAPGSASTRVPPDPNARTTSPVNTSKLALARLSHRHRSPTVKCAPDDHAANTPSSAAWDTTTPFGRPVDPDV